MGLTEERRRLNDTELQRLWLNLPALGIETADALEQILNEAFLRGAALADAEKRQQEAERERDEWKRKAGANRIMEGLEEHRGDLMEQRVEQTESRLRALEEENARLRAVAEQVLAARDKAMLSNEMIKIPDKVWVAIVMSAFSALERLETQVVEPEVR